jgi:hypothetical protein
MLGAASLLNFSEFGLIVMAISVSQAWIEPYWVSVLALTIAFSYLAAAILNRNVSMLYRKFRSKLIPLENPEVHPLEKEIVIGGANVLVFGMGRIGKGVCSSLCQDPQWKPLGFDYSPEVVSSLQGYEFSVELGDGTNPDFWSRIDMSTSDIRIVVLALPLAKQNIKVARALRFEGYRGPISSVAKYLDEIEDLQHAGIDRAFYLYAEAGFGFAESSKQLLEELEEKKKCEERGK